MRFILGSLFVSLMGMNAYGQATESTTFLYNFFGRSARIVYMDKLWESELEQMSNALAQDTLRGAFGTRRGGPDDYLVLTQKERSYIQNECRLQSEITWDNGLFPNGKVLTKDTVDTIFTNKTRGWTYFQAHYGSRLYSFSRPIFIRGDSLCIFYAGQSCGPLCGEGKLTVFKKMNGSWVPWIDLLVWMS